MKDLYEILGLDSSSTNEQIKKAYRQLSMKWHPDKNNGNDAKFKEINAAYETLSDSEKKQEYDMEKNNPFTGGFPLGETDLINMIFAGLPGVRTRMPDMAGSWMSNPHIKIFKTGVPMDMEQTLQKPVPIIKTIEITLQQAFTGGKVPIDIERWVNESSNRDTLKRTENETIYVEIPVGTDDNEIIVLREKGNIISDTNKGDIKIFIKVKNTSDFKRSGLDLSLNKDISLKEALCGFSFNMEHISGKVYTINNSNGNVINPNYRKVLPNMGMKRDSHAGNLIITFNVTFPNKFTEEQIEKLKDIL